MEDFLRFLKEYNIIGSVITGVIGAFAMLTSMRLFAKKIRAENKLLITNHANRIDLDFAKFREETNRSLAEMNHILEKGFSNFENRFSALESQQQSFQQEASAKEVLLRNQFEQIATTLNQWLGNVDNIYTTIHETILPNLHFKKNVKLRYARRNRK